MNKQELQQLIFQPDLDMREGMFGETKKLNRELDGLSPFPDSYFDSYGAVTLDGYQQLVSASKALNMRVSQKGVADYLEAASKSGSGFDVSFALQWLVYIPHLLPDTTHEMDVIKLQAAAAYQNAAVHSRLLGQSDLAVAFLRRARRISPTSQLI